MRSLLLPVLLMACVAHAETGSSATASLDGWEVSYASPSRAIEGRPSAEDPSVPAEGWAPWSPRQFHRAAGTAFEAWYRVRLPKGSWADPTLLLEDVGESFTAFVAGRQVYQYGQMGPGEGTTRLGYRWHLVPLPPDFSGRWLLLHVRSNNPLHEGLLGGTRLGGRGRLLLALIRGGMLRAIAGLTSVSIGAFALLVALRRRDQRAYFFFALYAVAEGVVLVSVSSLHPLLFDNPLFWSCLRYVGRAVAFPMLLCFTAEVLEAWAQWRLKWIAPGIAMAGLLMVALDAIAPGPFQLPTSVFLNLVWAGTSVLVVAVTVRAFARIRHAWCLGAAIVFQTVTVLFSAATHPEGPSHPGLEFWSQVAVLLAMGDLLLRRFTAVFDQLHLELRRRDEFLSIASHELRNPLAVVAASSRLLARTSRESAARPHLDQIERQVVHLHRLVDDLLDVSRLSHGKLKLQTEPLSLASLLERCVEEARTGALQKGVTLQHPPAVEPLWILGDAIRLDQTFGNLLRNAVKYTSPGGTVQVTTETSDGRVRVHVVDDGAGMTHQTLSRLFTMYEQGSQSLLQGRDGMGVGLALVRRLLELHGGAVSAWSGGHGEGSEFVVDLPLLPGGGPPPVSPVAPQPEAVQAGGRSVLLIDDNRNLRTSMRLLLEHSGYTITEAADGREGLERLLAGSYDAAVVDLQMPLLDGLEVARRARSSRLGSKIQLIALTGHGLPEDLRRAEQAGFNHVLVKPADPDRLARLLQENPQVF